LGLATAAVLAVFVLRYLLNPTVTLHGRVTFEGPPLPAVTFSLPGDSQGSRPLDDGSFLLAPDGSLANVLVYIQDGVARGHDLQCEPVRVEQSKCLFRPRVLGVRVNQPVEFTNQDPGSHTVSSRPRRNGEFNLSNQPGDQPLSTVFAHPETPPLVVECHVHRRWERAFVGVFDHPWFAVTGPDGTFTLPEKLRPGAYTLVAWHERLGIREHRVFLCWPQEAVRLTIGGPTGS
jgi:plastocyanin